MRPRSETLPAPRPIGASQKGQPSVAQSNGSGVRGSNKVPPDSDRWEKIDVPEAEWAPMTKQFPVIAQAPEPSGVRPPGALTPDLDSSSEGDLPPSSGQS